MSLFNWSQERRIDAACGCSKGLLRGNNEDNFYFDGDHLEAANDGMAKVLTSSVFVSDKTDEAGHFYAVFDGMGGGEYGEIAAYTAARVTREKLADKNAICSLDVSKSLEELCDDLNEAVFHESVERYASHMGSTIAGIFFFAGHAWSVNMGDSRCYRLRKGVFEQISIDHNDADIMRMHGIQGRKPFLTQYLGLDSDEVAACPAVIRSKVSDNDLYLICSDGLTDMVSENRIVDILSVSSSPEEQVKSLTVEALKNGGKDNITIIICSIVSE